MSDFVSASPPDFQAQLLALSKRLEVIERHLGIPPLAAPPTATRQSVAPSSIPVVPAPTARPSAVLPETIPPSLPNALLLAGKGLHADEPIYPGITSSFPAVASNTTSASTRPNQSTLTAPRDEPDAAIDWENLIGGKWALWLGATSLFLALAFFLAYTWKSLPPPPPWARVAMGVGCGAAFLGGGAWSRGRAQRWYSEGLFGAGLAVLYLSIWAGAQHFHIVPLNAAFVAMTLTTTLGVWLAVRYDAPALSVLATCGGFLTPVVLQASGGGAGVAQALSLLIYVAVLDAGILATSLWKRWRGLTWLAFGATILLISGWAEQSYTHTLCWPVFGFLALYFGLFFGAACFHSLKRREPTAHADLLLFFASTAVYFGCGLELMRAVFGRFPAAFPIVLAAFFLAMSFWIRQRAPENSTLRQSAGGLVLFFVTIALPIQLRAPWVAIAWSLEAALLLVVARRLRGTLLLLAGQTVWLLSFVPLVLTLFSTTPQTRVAFFNESALPLMLSVFATWSVLAYDGHIRRHQSTLDSAQASDNAPLLDGLATAYAMWAVFGGAWLLAQEIMQFFALRAVAQGTGDSSLRAASFYGFAIAWAAYAPLVLAAGLRWRDSVLRGCALVVAVLAVGVSFWTTCALPQVSWSPFVSIRAFSYLAIILSMMVTGKLMTDNRDDLDSGEREILSFWPAALAICLLIAVSTETYFGFLGGQQNLTGDASAVLPHVLGIIWIAGGCISLWLGCARGDIPLRILGLLAVTCSGIGLVLNASESLLWLPFLNWRFGSFVVAVAGLAIASALLHRYRDVVSKEEASLTGTLLFAAAGVLLWALTRETYETARFFQQAIGGNWTRTAQMAISLVWCGYGALTLIVGIRRDLRTVRLAALGLLALTSLKVFTLDLSFLDMASRIFAFAGLGIALLFISWLYGRYGQKNAPPPDVEKQA